MKFTKMTGAGNDYVYVDCTGTELKNAAEIARIVSNRNFGIGSDGLILIKHSDKADFYMEMYNADGSQGAMCGNGIRCVGKYVYDNGLTGKKNITIETLSGIKELELYVKHQKVSSVRVNMGSPILKAGDIPVLSENETVIKELILAGGNQYYMTCVSMGNPHAVIFMDSVEDLDLEKLGPLFENHSRFPDRINAEFIQVVDRKNLNMRVWERGSGETLACGTGACAALVAAVLNGLCEDTAVLHLKGGDLIICWEREENKVYMEGPAVTVFTGEIDIDMFL